VARGRDFFNHPNFDIPDNEIDGSTFGRGYLRDCKDMCVATPGVRHLVQLPNR